MLDEFPEVRLGDWIRAVVDIRDDDGSFIAAAGDIGHVLEKNLGHWPTCRFERTGRVTDCAPSEFELLCDAEFARSAETTPKAPMKRFVRNDQRKN